MKHVQWISGVIGAMAFVFVLLITGFELAAYSNFGFYEKEYEKYQVLDDVQMEMDDVMYVTREMMSYLKGQRDDLVVETIVDGQEREFFNDREKAHMEDVQHLFRGGIMLRRIAFGIAVICFGVLIFLKGDWKRVLPRAYLIGTGIFFGIFAVLGVLFASDFSKYFTIFHEIFFTNDLWLLDPATDLMINILPEGFFADMLIRIALFFAVGLLITIAASVLWILKINRANKYHKIY